MKIYRLAQTKHEGIRKLHEVDLIEPISLTEGEHPGLRYGHVVELYGQNYKTQTAIRCTREHCGGTSVFVFQGNKLYQAYGQNPYYPDDPTMLSSLRW